MNHYCLKWLLCVNLAWLMVGSNIAVALPPSEDIPEEVLRTQIITEGRSPLNGEPLTAAEYAQLKAELAESPYPPQVNSQLEHIIFLLKVRKMLKTFFPLDLF